MIGEPTIDPALGDKRRKALLAALQQAAGMSGMGNQLPAYGAIGRGAVSGFGIRSARSGARPSAILNFLSLRGPNGYARGLSAYHQASGGLGTLVANPQAPSPLPPVNSNGGTVGTTGGSVPTSGVGSPSGLQATASALNVEDPNKSIPAQVTPSGSVFEGSLPSYTDVMSPSSGWIPLGGGMFLDPDTGILHGSGTVSGGLRA